MLLKKPIITEKTVMLANTQNQYTFEVAMRANKIAAAKELEDQFGVTVTGTKTHTRLGKAYTYGRSRRATAMKPARKFMIFELKSGDKIDVFTN